VKKPEFPKRKNNKNSQYYRPERMIIKGCCKNRHKNALVIPQKGHGMPKKNSKGH
jgi:hypothetical protein